MELYLHRYAVLDSTNNAAAEAARNGAPEGTVVAADRQTGGRGRLRRVWHSPQGGLYFSLIARPRADAEYAPQLSLLMGVAIAKALRRLYADDAICLKWPNDVLWQNKKVCGILAEMQLTVDGNVDYVCLGAGINVNADISFLPLELQPTAACLNAALAKSHSCDAVLKTVFEEFAALYENWQKNGPAEVMRLWRQYNCTLGKKITVQDNEQCIFRGTAIDIDPYGALIVRAANGEEKVYDFGEISIR